MPKAAVQSIDRALSILEEISVSKDGLGVTELSARVGLHKSTTHRLLSALLERGYVEKTHGANYRLGGRIIDLSSLFLNQIELKTEAQPYLYKLLQLSKQPVHLGILEGLEVIYIDKLESLSSIRMYSQLGRRVPATCTAMGKSLLSDTGEREVRALLEQVGMRAYTTRSITNADGFIKELRSVRHLGFSRDDQEYEVGIRCIAAPIRDYRGNIIAAVSTSGLKQVITPDRDEEIASYVKEAAASISQRMGYRKLTVPVDVGSIRSAD